jgi:hypothetical protein
VKAGKPRPPAAFPWLCREFGCVGNDDAALRLFLSFDAADDDAVLQWTEFHRFRSRLTFDADAGRKALVFGSGFKRAVDSRG